MALYGRSKKAWLESLLTLPNGAPSHDTFRRVFMLLEETLRHSIALFFSICAPAAPRLIRSHLPRWRNDFINRQTDFFLVAERHQSLRRSSV